MQIDQLIKMDRLHLLRQASLALPLPPLEPEEQPTRNYLWLFIDPIDNQHLVSHAPHTALLTQDPTQPAPQYHYLLQHDPTLPPLTFPSNPLLATQLTPNAISHLAKTEIVSIDQVRLRAEANTYTSADTLERDIRTIISWHQFYRANSLNAY